MIRYTTALKSIMAPQLDYDSSHDKDYDWPFIFV